MVKKGKQCPLGGPACCRRSADRWCSRLSFSITNSSCEVRGLAVDLDSVVLALRIRPARFSGTIPSSDMFSGSVRIRFGFGSRLFGSDSVRIRFGFGSRFGSDSVRIRFRFGSDSVRIRFRFGSDSVQIRFGFGSDSIQIRFGFDSDSVRIRFRFG